MLSAASVVTVMAVMTVVATARNEYREASAHGDDGDGYDEGGEYLLQHGELQSGKVHTSD